MENEFSRVFKVLPGLVWIELPDRQSDFHNFRWRKNKGPRFHEASSERWLTAIHREDLLPLANRWRSILAPGEPGEMD
jgi:hypothetical protein